MQHSITVKESTVILHPLQFLVDKPLIQYTVEEAVASGIEDIIIITGRGKRAIEDHFDRSVELEENLKGTGKSHIAIGIARAVIRLGRKARFFNAVDLVNKLEAEPLTTTVKDPATGKDIKVIIDGGALIDWLRNQKLIGP